MKTKRMVLLAMLTAAAGILHTVEGWLPLPAPIPGIKLGIANVVTLVVILVYGRFDAYMVSTARVLIGSLLGGMFFGPVFAMSLAAALASTAVMALLAERWSPPFSLIGISVMGAAVHNAAQLVIASLLVGSLSLLWYLPYLVLAGIATGILTGIIASYFMHKAVHLL